MAPLRRASRNSTETFETPIEEVFNRIGSQKKSPVRANGPQFFRVRLVQLLHLLPGVEPVDGLLGFALYSHWRRPMHEPCVSWGNKSLFKIKEPSNAQRSK